MALTVEDGTGLAGADTYATVAEVDARLEALGGPLADEWGGADDADKELALRRATVYVDAHFAELFVGSRSSAAQALEWPRSYATSRAGFDVSAAVPAELKAAVGEYAARALTINLMPDPTQPYSQASDGGAVTASSTGRVTSRRSRAGPVESEVSYSETAPRGSGVGASGLARAEDLPSYPSTDLLLRALLRPTQARAYR